MGRRWGASGRWRIGTSGSEVVNEVLDAQNGTTGPDEIPNIALKVGVRKTQYMFAKVNNGGNKT